VRYSLEVQESDTSALLHTELTPSGMLLLPLQMMKKMKKKMKKMVLTAMLTKMKVGVEEETCLLSKLWLL